MNFRKILALTLALVMVLGTMSTVAFAEETVVAKIGTTEYTNFKAAMTDAYATSGDVEVEIYGAVEFVNGMELKGNYDSISFIGMNDDAKLDIQQSAGGDYLEAHGETLTFTDLKLAKTPAAWANNSGHMGNFFSVQGGKATYNNCTFLNGACTSGGTATYNNCTFQNETYYGLWVYDDALVTVSGGAIDSVRGIKVYAEDETTVTSTLTVENATFTDSITEKGAVCIAYAESVTLTGNVWNNTAPALELDSGSDADCEGVTFAAVDANGNDITSTLTAVDRSNGNAYCGVFVTNPDGTTKVYTTVTTAAEEAKTGDTVTLLYDAPEEEEVVFAAGVTIDTNSYSAPGVTTDVAAIGDDSYATLEAAIAAAEVGDTIKLYADVNYDNYVYASGKTTSVNIPAGKEFTLDLNGYTISGENSSPKSFELITICNGAIVTIDDTSAAQTGKITYEATREEPDGWIDRAHTIFNQGTLILNGGTIENATPESQEAVSSAVDNNCSWGKLGSFTMNGGVVTSAGYYAVRTDVNTHNTTANGTLKAVTNFNGGTVYGFYLMDRGSDLPKMPVNDIEFAVGDDAVVEPANFSNAAAIRIRYGATSKVAVEISEEAEINGAVTGAAAKVGGAYYKTLDEAIAAAVAGDTIDLLGNVIEINESKDNMDRDKNLTFENGTLDLTYAGSSDSMFTLYGSETLTFNNVDFVKRDIGLDAKFMCYFINISSANAVVKFNNCDFDFDGSYCTAYDGEWPGHGLWSSVIANNAGGKIYLTDCNIEHEYGNFIYQGGATITNCTYNGYADLDEGDTAGNFLNHNTFPTVISNSNINTRIFGLRNANNKVEIKDNTYIYASLFRISTPLADGETAPVYLDATSKIEAVEMDLTIINEDSEGEIVSEASSVYVQYKKIDSEEGTDKYEIVLVGANNVAGKELINELASADLTFDFEGTLLNGAAMDYAVEAADGVSVTKLGDRYLFNYNGVDKYEESGTAIVIGTITIEGYGSYTLKTDEQAKNAVYATEIRDNIVDGYEDAATLVINADMAEDDGMVGMIDPAATIAVPVRDLAIDIAFKNAVENQSKAYQDMKVVISGGDLAENIEIKLGTDWAATGLEIAGKADAAVDVAYANNAYTVAVTDALTLNRAYTVTISGAGYRTARYTVTMTTDKELSFWNNVMDNDTAVEEGEFETTKTFLAGDIVKDNNINVYDLSAVVSYFGTDGINTQDVSEYAKYDLNRDGVIDSKDVAYVLVSWGE